MSGREQTNWGWYWYCGSLRSLLLLTQRASLFIQRSSNSFFSYVALHPSLPFTRGLASMTLASAHLLPTPSVAAKAPSPVAARPQSPAGAEGESPPVSKPSKSMLKKLKTSSSAISPFGDSVSMKKAAHIPVFMVCTSWGSPYMIYGPTGLPTALYFLSPADAYGMGQEFLQLTPERGGNSVHIMVTSMERALRHSSGKDLPTGSVGDDGKIEVRISPL